MLENDDNQTEQVKNFIAKIKPALWKEDEMTGKEDRNNILLRSEVVTDSGNDTLRDMATGSIAKYLEENLFRMVSEEKLLQKLHKRTNQ